MEVKKYDAHLTRSQKKRIIEKIGLLVENGDEGLKEEIYFKTADIIMNISVNALSESDMGLPVEVINTSLLVASMSFLEDIFSTYELPKEQVEFLLSMIEKDFSKDDEK